MWDLLKLYAIYLNTRALAKFVPRKCLYIHIIYMCIYIYISISISQLHNKISNFPLTSPENETRKLLRDRDHGLRSTKPDRCSLRFLDVIRETKTGPFLARHQCVVHPAVEILLRGVSAHCILMPVFSQAAHILDHQALAATLMIQGEAPFVGRGRNELFLREGVR